MLSINIADRYLSHFPPQNIFVIWDDDFNIDCLFTNVNIFFPFFTLVATEGNPGPKETETCEYYTLF